MVFLKKNYFSSCVCRVIEWLGSIICLKKSFHHLFLDSNFFLSKKSLLFSTFFGWRKRNSIFDWTIFRFDISATLIAVMQMTRVDSWFRRDSIHIMKLNVTKLAVNLIMVEKLEKREPRVGNKKIQLYFWKLINKWEPSRKSALAYIGKFKNKFTFFPSLYKKHIYENCPSWDLCSSLETRPAASLKFFL